MDHQINEKIQAFARETPAGSVILDVGCGLRPYERHFAHCKYIGIDIEVSGRSLDTKKPDKFYNGVDIPFDADEIDVVICNQVLEHCLEPETLVSEMHRVLRPGGTVFLTVPLTWGEHETPYDFRRYTSFGIRKLFEDVGLRIQEQGKLTPGIDAVEKLVNSEIHHHRHTDDFKNRRRILKERGAGLMVRLKTRVAEMLERRVWRLQLTIWRSMYVFHRIYIDNFVIARKPEEARTQ